MVTTMGRVGLTRFPESNHIRWWIVCNVVEGFIGRSVELVGAELVLLLKDPIPILMALFVIFQLRRRFVSVLGK